MTSDSQTGGKYFITGASGFIGGALAAALTGSGNTVTVGVRPQNIGRVKSLNCANINSFDLIDPAGWEDSIPICDVLIHAASIRNRWGTKTADYLQVNVEATRHLLEASVGKVKRFVYISSVGVYGYPGKTGIDENDSLIDTNGKLDYHRSKVMAERVVQSYSSKLETVIIRPTITYGVGDTNGMVTRLIRMVWDNRYIQVGGGKNFIHLTYIDDLVNGIMLASASRKANGQIVNLCGGVPIRMGALVNMVQAKLGSAQRIWKVPEIPARAAGWLMEVVYKMVNQIAPSVKLEPVLTGDKINVVCKNRGFSFQKAKTLMGYSPQLDYEAGITKTIEWMKSTGQLKVQTE